MKPRYRTTMKMGGAHIYKLGVYFDGGSQHRALKVVAIERYDPTNPDMVCLVLEEVGALEHAWHALGHTRLAIKWWFVYTAQDLRHPRRYLNRFRRWKARRAKRRAHASNG